MSGLNPKTTRSQPRSILSLALLVVVLLLDIPYTNARCLRRCNSCRNGVINCTNRNLLAPPREYPRGISTVVLSNNRIRFLGPNAFRRNTNVETLKMQSNRIIALRNRSFMNLPNLANLDLNSNIISRVHTGALRNMNALRSLFLSRNRIRNLSGLFRDVPLLYHLNLAKNKLRTIHLNDFSSLQNLYYLDLRHNKISHIHTRAFANLPRLRHLFLNNNNITGRLQLVFGSTVLQLVDLSHCNLTAVPGIFPSSLSDLRISYNNISMVNGSDFSSVSNLRMLALENNRIHYFEDGALSHLSELNEVWLRHNRLNHIPRDLPANLHRLHMGFNNVEILGANLFRTDSRLKILSVENNRISRIHPNAFRSLRFLQVVNVQNNNIQRLEPRTFNALGGLNIITLNNNSLHTIEPLAFRNMANLTTLHLNYIMAEPFQLRDNFLRAMLRLQDLYMMSSPGLAQALMNKINNLHPNDLVPMSNLRKLDLSYNNLHSVSSRIRTLFPNIQSIPLDGNTFRCSRSLSWLANWMRDGGRTVFYNYENVMCETPASLAGRQLETVRIGEMAVDAARRSSPQIFQRGRENPVALTHRAEDTRERPVGIRQTSVNTRQRSVNTRQRSVNTRRSRLQNQEPFDTANRVTSAERRRRLNSRRRSRNMRNRMRNRFGARRRQRRTTSG